MTLLTVAGVVKSVRDLPSLPVIVIEVLNSFEQPDASLGLLAGKVAQDQALSAKVLRLSNSSFYGLSRKVTTIQQAITVLGFDSVRTLIAAAAVTDRFSGMGYGSFDFRAFWRHAIATALCAKALARVLGLNQDYAFVSGLLHDIGKLVLVTGFPAEYEAATAYRTEHDCYMLEAEHAVLGVDHAQVGRALAEHWKFPVPMQKALADHHAPDGDDPGISHLVHIADAIVHALDMSQHEDDLVPVVHQAAWHRLDVDADVFNAVCRDTELKFDEACKILVA
jgi:putative nucleotidyltransferase with HDIG domain